MADCERLAGCPFFHSKMANMPKVADILKQQYCRGENGKCARYMVFKALGRGRVPADLFPDQITVALDLLEREES